MNILQSVSTKESRSEFASSPFFSAGRDAKTEQGNQREIKHAKRSGRRIGAHLQRPRDPVTRSDSSTRREPASIRHCGPVAKSCIQGLIYCFSLLHFSQAMVQANHTEARLNAKINNLQSENVNQRGPYPPIQGPIKQRQLMAAPLDN